MPDKILKKGDDIWFTYKRVGHYIFKEPIALYKFKTKGSQPYHIVCHQPFDQQGKDEMRTGMLPLSSREEAYRVNILTNGDPFDPDDIGQDHLEHFTDFALRAVGPDKNDPINGGFNTGDNSDESDRNKTLTKKGFCFRQRLRLLSYRYRFECYSGGSLDTFNDVVLGPKNVCGADYNTSVTHPLALGGSITDEWSGFPNFGPNTVFHSISGDGSTFTQNCSAGRNAQGHTRGYIVIDDSNVPPTTGRMGVLPYVTITEIGGGADSTIDGKQFADCGGGEYTPGGPLIIPEQGAGGSIVMFERLEIDKEERDQTM